MSCLGFFFFEKDGLNKGGAFNGVIEDNLTTQYLVEASNFTRAAGGNNRQLQQGLYIVDGKKIIVK